MPQSLDHVIVHIIFATKGRRPFLPPTIQSQLHAYLATVARNAGCECPRVGGVADHVHLAIFLGRTIKISQLIEELKTSSSKWLKTQSSQSANLKDFEWQRGYAIFSVGPQDIDALIEYIDNQTEHHRTRTFEEEYRAFLDKYQVKYDERYMWD
jgi:putative transposase